MKFPIQFIRYFWWFSYYLLIYRATFLSFRVFYLFWVMEQTSNGPLLEFLVRNSSLWSTVSEDEIEVSLGCDLQVNYYNIDKV